MYQLTQLAADQHRQRLAAAEAQRPAGRALALARATRRAERAEHFLQDWFEREVLGRGTSTRLSSGDPQQSSRRLVVSCRWSRSWPCAELTANRVSCRRTAGPGLAARRGHAGRGVRDLVGA
jgi:hypothetical protein